MTNVGYRQESAKDLERADILSTAPDGIYRVLDNGERVRKTGEYYDALTDRFTKNVELELMARVDSDGIKAPALGETTFRPDRARVVMLFLPVTP